jgi:hypothetical protein
VARLAFTALAAAMALASGCNVLGTECPAGAACPATASVAGTGYALTRAMDLLDAEADLHAYATVERTNSPEMFAGREAFALADVPAEALLIARAAPVPDEPGAYILLWGPRAEDAFPTLCRYLTLDHVAVQEQCR